MRMKCTYIIKSLHTKCNDFIIDAFCMQRFYSFSFCAGRKPTIVIPRPVSSGLRAARTSPRHTLCGHGPHRHPVPAQGRQMTRHPASRSRHPGSPGSVPDSSIPGSARLAAFAFHMITPHSINSEPIITKNLISVFQQMIIV